MIFALLFAGALAANTPTTGTIGWDVMPDALIPSCGETLDSNAQNWAGDYNNGFIRIEQCGARIAILGAGVTHDFTAADGTYENGVDDVGAACVGLPALPHILAACKVVVKAEWDNTCLRLYRDVQGMSVHVVSWCDAGTAPNG